MSLVAAVMVVRDEADIVADSIGHLLALGVDRVLVADNGSTDGTAALLRRIAARDGRVEWREADGPFAQGEITSRLADEARRDGAAWILPNDADEFLDPGPGGLAALAEAPGGPDGVGAWEIPVRNFVQCRAALALDGAFRRRGTGAIDTMLFAARALGTRQEARGLVESGAAPFVRTTYPPKHVFRAAEGLRVHAGAHFADGIAGRVARHPAATLLHAPIRSPGAIARRQQKGVRAEAVATGPRENWHLRRLVALDDSRLADEWRINSTAVGLGRGWTLDLRLRRIGRALAGFRRSLRD